MSKNTTGHISSPEHNTSERQQAKMPTQFRHDMRPSAYSYMYSATALRDINPNHKPEPNFWPFELKWHIGYHEGTFLDNVHTNFALSTFSTPFCFRVMSPYGHRRRDGQTMDYGKTRNAAY